MQALTAEPPAAARLAERHPAWVSISLHLLPGILIGAVYYLLAPFAARLGLPSVAALLAAGVLVTIPFELGVIAWAARTSAPQPLPFREMIAYREPLPWWQYPVWVLLILVATALLFALFNPVTSSLQRLFGWLPEAMMLNFGQVGAFSRPVLIWSTLFGALLVGFIVPTVEELYFRGFLLPRMPERLGRWTPLAYGFLFALYHTWTPWMVAARTVGLLPLIYVVQRKRNVYLGIIAHILVNLIDIGTMVAFIVKMG